MFIARRKYRCTANCKYKLPSFTFDKIKTEIKKTRCSKYQEKKVVINNNEFPSLTKEQLDVFDENFKSYTFPKTSTNGLVIVENRKDKRLEVVIKNIAYYVPNWKLHIFHSKENKDFILTILGNKIDNVELHLLDKPIKSNQDYNFVIKDITFWKKMIEHERVLIFQTDTLVLRFGIEKFLKYDYIGAPWQWWTRHFNDTERIAGNGGFSLRKVTKMIDVIKKYSSLKKSPIPDYHNEDVFFSYHLYQDKKAILPNWNTAMLFASESLLCTNTLALHQAWKFHENFKLKFVNKENITF